jgi:hypothetical protein
LKVTSAGLGHCTTRAGNPIFNADIIIFLIFFIKMAVIGVLQISLEILKIGIECFD